MEILGIDYEYRAQQKTLDVCVCVYTCIFYYEKVDYSFILHSNLLCLGFVFVLAFVMMPPLSGWKLLPWKRVGRFGTLVSRLQVYGVRS